MSPLALFGGTFDPIHYGHLRLVEELADVLKFEEVRLIPAGQPPHRSAPRTSAATRLAMVRAATQANLRLTVDAREVDRAIHEGQPSYTVHTLDATRAEIGERPLCLLMGADAFLGLHRWHQWQRLLTLCHIVVTTRPGYVLKDNLPSELHGLWHSQKVTDSALLSSKSAGYLFEHAITPLDISATRIREHIQAGRSARYLTPDAVLDIIHQQGLYR